MSVTHFILIILIFIMCNESKSYIVLNQCAGRLIFVSINYVTKLLLSNTKYLISVVFEANVNLHTFFTIFLQFIVLTFRLSLQSHSSGSLDSMLNVSNDEERNTHDSMNHEVFVTPPNSDLVGKLFLTYIKKKI